MKFRSMENIHWRTWVPIAQHLRSMPVLAAVLILAIASCPGAQCRTRSPSPKAAAHLALAAGVAGALERLPVDSAVIEMVASKASLSDLLNPFSKAWNGTETARVSLHKQNLVVPSGGGSIKEVLVRAVRSQEGVAFRLEWADATRDNDTVHQVKFRDAVAIEFPIGGVKDTVLSMGSTHGPVNIWHWKADWEPDAPVMNAAPYEEEQARRGDKTSPVIYPKLAVDSYKEQKAAQGGSNGPASGVFNLFPQSAHGHSPVEDIIAIGISSITTKPERLQALKGRGEWKEGRWHVVIFKPLGSSDDPTSPKFELGGQLNIAFAVWNGSQQDRNGMKSISNWATLKCR